MKKTIPFTKEIHFKTVIAEITDIEVTHNLMVKDDNVVEGDIIVDGSYKIHEASQIEENFHYDLPFIIEVDDKYDIENSEIFISDFYFEIINEEDLKINVELEMRNVEEKNISLDEEVIRNHIEKIPVEMEEDIESLEIPSVNEIENDLNYIYDDEKSNIQSFDNQQSDESLLSINKQEDNFTDMNITDNNSYPNIFDTISTDETYVTYYVYIVRETDTVDSILDKYKVTREDLSLYNDLDNIKICTKVIIPCHNE